MVIFSVLGPLEVSTGSKLVNIGGVRSKRVLGMLLVRAGRVVSVEQLAKAVWEDPPPTAEHQVRKLVSDLRQRIPGGAELFETKDQGYCVTVAADQLDLHRFERHLADARAARAADDPRTEMSELGAALRLCRGAPLVGLDMTTEAAVVAIEERRLLTHERLIELRLKLEDPRDVVDELKEMVSEHPLRERLHSLLMTALYQSGRQAEAIEAYNDLRRMLADNLGIDPGPEASRCFQQILRPAPALEPGQPATPAQDNAFPVAPSSLPYGLPDFTGRPELDRLLEVAESASGRAPTIVTIDGMGGVGKTTLAVHAAHQLADRYPGGQLFIDLHGFTPGQRPVEPAEALDTLLRALGVPGLEIPDDLNGRTALWRVHTACRRLLLVLDNVASVAQVRPLLPGSGGSLVLVTGRVALTGLDGAVPLSLGLPSVADGVSLLRGVLGDDRVAAEREWALEVVASCGQLPLAVRIAATRLRDRPYGSIERLARRLRDKDSILDELVDADRSVRAVLEVSIESMGTPRQRLYHLLGRCMGVDFDAYAAAALAGLPVRMAARMLEDLLDARLLMQQAPLRYTFHDLLRNLVRTCADATGSDVSERDVDEDAPALRRLLDYYALAAQRAARRIRPGSPPLPLGSPVTEPELPAVAGVPEALAWFDAERHNLLAGIRVARRLGLDRHVAGIPLAMAYYYRVRGHLQDELDLLREALAAARRLGDRGLEVDTIAELAMPYWHLGRVREGLDVVLGGLDLAVETGNAAGEARCLARVAMFHKNLGRYDEAVRCLERSVLIHRAEGMHGELSAVLTLMSSALATLGRTEEALQVAAEALAHSRGNGEAYGEMVGLAAEARCHLELGRPDTAVKLLEDALPLARLLRIPNGEARVHGLFADAFRHLGRLDLAHQHARLSVEILNAVSQPGAKAAAHNVLGQVHHERGEHELARVHHQHADQLSQRTDLRIERARAVEGLARAAHAAGDVRAARQCWNDAVAQYTAMGLPVPPFP